MSRKLSADSKRRLKKREALKLKAYYDSGGQLSIGYGHTPDKYFSFNAKTVITEAKADELLEHDLQEAIDCIEKYVKVPLTDGQFGALVSFVYNIGCTKFIGSTLLKKLNAGDYASVPAQMLRWVKDQDPKTGKLVDVEGLKNRRASEIGEWAAGSKVVSKDVRPTEAGSDLDKIAKPLAQATTTYATIGTTTTGILGAFSGLDWRFASLLTLVMVGFAIYILYERRKHAKIASSQET